MKLAFVFIFWVFKIIPNNMILQFSCNDFKGKIRNCEVADIYRIIKKMKLNHQITNRHLRVMVKWGQLECSPYYHYRAKRSEIRLWDEGLHALEGWLLSKGIITL